MSGMSSELNSSGSDKHETGYLEDDTEAFEASVPEFADPDAGPDRRPPGSDGATTGDAEFEAATLPFAEPQRGTQEQALRAVADRAAAPQPMRDVPPPAAEDLPSGDAPAGAGPRAAADTGLRASRPEPRTGIDRRGNDVAATVQETRWSIGLWNSLSPEQLEPLLDHVTSLLDMADAFETRFSPVLPKLSASERATMEERFGHARSMGNRLDAWADDFDKVKLCEIVLDSESGLKVLADLLTKCLGMSDASFSRPARDQPFFTDRGRQILPEEQQRSESVWSRHAGITEGRNRTRSMENIFSIEMFHHKGEAERTPGSRTVQRFEDSNVPFIGGASGTVEQIVAMMEREKPREALDDEELHQREQVITLYSAMHVIVGHHSLIENLLPAQAYGYFRDAPDALASPENYTAAIDAIKNRFPDQPAAEE